MSAISASISASLGLHVDDSSSDVVPEYVDYDEDVDVLEDTGDGRWNL